jgi:hypothetical protein
LLFHAASVATHDNTFTVIGLHQLGDTVNVYPVGHHAKLHADQFHTEISHTTKLLVFSLNVAVTLNDQLTVAGADDVNDTVGLVASTITVLHSDQDHAFHNASIHLTLR